MIQPYQFYPAFKSCPNCRTRLLTTVPITRKFLQGVLHDLGIVCTCVRCSRRYRATSWLRYSWIAWAGPVGQWIWWQTTSLTETDRPTES